MSKRKAEEYQIGEKVSICAGDQHIPCKITAINTEKKLVKIERIIQKGKEKEWSGWVPPICLESFNRAKF